MIITQKSIRSAERYLNSMTSNKVKIIVEIRPELLNALNFAGYSKPYSEGDTILPNAIGSVSSFNADGRYIKLKDLPKEPRYITTAEWTWKQWCGRGETKTITESRDIYKDCYQRKFYSPPSLELTLIKLNGQLFVVSQEFKVNKIKAELFKHAINLFLELFGECEIRRHDLTSFTPTHIKRVNWSILPPGKYPWDKVQKHVKNIVKDKHTKYSNVILDRQNTLSNYKPDEVYVGNGGFRSYVAYIFKAKKLVVLESVQTDNATYIFGDDWKQVSMLTKAEILENMLQKNRLIHSKGWETRLKIILSPEDMLVA